MSWLRVWRSSFRLEMYTGTKTAKLSAYTGPMYMLSIAAGPETPQAWPLALNLKTNEHIAVSRPEIK